MSAKNGVDGVQCDRLGNVDGVAGSGAVRDAETELRLPALPSSAVPLKEATPGFLRLLRGYSKETASSGVLVSRQVSELWRKGLGDQIETPIGSSTIGGVYEYPEDGRSPGLAFAAVAEAPPGTTFDECWADIWPVSEARSQLLRTTLSASSPADLDVQIHQLNSKFGSSFDGPRRYAKRSTASAAILSALAGFILGFVALRARRIETASARHSGVPLVGQLAQVTMETALWVACAVVLATPILLYRASQAYPSAVPAIFWLGERCLAAAGACAILGSALSVAVTRERHLFRYFKER
jgi:uncharacterized membrane protein